MNPRSPSDIERDEKINVVVFEFESAVDRGESPDPAEWVALHPDLAPELAEYFEGLATLGLSKPRDQETTQDFKAAASHTSTAVPPSRLGDYLLLERLGRGGEGTVYRARHRVNDHEVALKMVSAASGTDLGGDVRLRDEARAIAGLRHPHIVRIHFSGEDQGIWYYTMEVMEGGGLEERIDEFKKNPTEAADLVRKIAQGIHHAHTRGILHLDLKPANVLLDLDGTPHVSDFGLALRLRARNELGETSAEFSTMSSGELPVDPGPGVLNMTKPQVRGTAPYMSPEMAAGRLAAVSTSADVYGLGAILYTLITGRPPTVGTSMSDTLFRVIHERPTPPRTLNKRVDRELQAVCLKCLRKDPAKRYGSADALANDLGRFLRGEPTLAGEPTALRRTWFWFRRNPWGTAAAVLTFLVLWLASVIGSLGEIREGNRREANRLAREASIQIKMIERAITLLAKEPEFRRTLKDWPDGSPQQLKELNRILLRANAECNSWFGITGGNPVVNVFILNNDGVMLADSTPRSASVGLTFTLRDYFHHFREESDSPANRDDVYVSRTFRSIKDSHYRFAVSTRIWDGDLELGVIVANVTIGRTLLLLDMAEEPAGVFVAAPVDPSYPFRHKDVDPASEHPGYIAVLHGSYQDATQPPIMLSSSDFSRLSKFEEDPSMLRSAEFDRGGSAIHYQRVGNTHLVVVAQRPYPWPVRPFLDARQRPWAILAVITVVISPFVFWSRHRKSRAVPPTTAMGSSLLPSK